MFSSAIALVYQSPVSHVSLTVFVLRIKKLEKEKALIRQCKRNGWTDLCGEVEQYEKVLEHGKDAESMRFHSSVFLCWW